MNYKTELQKQKTILEDMGYTVAYICLYGSQNYGLDVYSEEYQSDIDMKAIVVPTLDDLIKDSKPVSKVYETEWGQVDVKDIRVYMQTLIKANPSYIETIFTEYYIVDDLFKEQFVKILGNADYLVNTLKYQFLRAIYGMMCEKQKAMCHPYPSIAHKIEKFGYDPKQVHHVYRLKMLMEDYFVNGYDLFDALIADEERNYLIDLKLGKYKIEEVVVLVERWMNEAKELRDSISSNVDEKTIDYNIKDEYIESSNEIIKRHIERDCNIKLLDSIRNSLQGC